MPDGIETKVNLDLLEHRDLIVFDQRGAGLSDPNLECPEREAALLQALSAATPWADEVASFTSALATCYQRLTQDRHVDLDQYNTITNAEDLNDIRIALGISQWNLWGVSYGTRLAMEEMRSFPEGVRSAVLDSVYPPSAGAADDAVRSGERAFQALADGCAHDGACHRAIPDLAALIEQLAVKLDAKPINVTSKPPGGGDSRKLVITGDDAIGGLFTAMYDSDLIPLLPKIINDLAQGDTSVVPEIANRGIEFVDESAEGAYLSTECADNNVKIDPRAVARLRQDPGRAGLALLASWSLFCGSWPVDALPAKFSETVHSDIPAIVFAGEYDPITPPDGSRQAAVDLGNAQFVQVPRGPCRGTDHAMHPEDLHRLLRRPGQGRHRMRRHHVTPRVHLLRLTPWAAKVRLGAAAPIRAWGRRDRRARPRGRVHRPLRSGAVHLQPTRRLPPS